MFSISFTSTSDCWVGGAPPVQRVHIFTGKAPLGWGQANQIIRMIHPLAAESHLPCSAVGEVPEGPDHSDYASEILGMDSFENALETENR